MVLCALNYRLHVTLHEHATVLCYPAGVIMMLRELDRQAKLEGGRVIMLNGNHESLNVCGDFRWALVVLRPSFGEAVRTHSMTPSHATEACLFPVCS